MLYFDNAATSWPKPEIVHKTMTTFYKNYGANPGRGGHAMAMEAEHTMNKARAGLAKFFSVEKPERLVFTFNATDALNIAIKGIVKQGDHVISSMLEHNSVTRPLVGLHKAGGIALDRVGCGKEGQIDPSDVEKLIQGNTSLIVLTHCSNVTGILQPIEQVAQIAREHGVPLLVDASQTAGVYPIDVGKLGCDLLAAPGHKGLLGPTGTGILYVKPGLELGFFREGGTGSESERATHPLEMPFRLEGGTPNTLGIVGLAAGVGFLQEQGTGSILEHERRLGDHFLAGLEKLPGIQVHGSRRREDRVGIVSLNIEDMEPVDVSAILDQSFGIAVRAGLHCAPVMHEMLGTLPQGSVRFSFGFANTLEEVDAALTALGELLQG